MELEPNAPLVLAALANQEKERSTGFALANPALARIHEVLSRSELLNLVRTLRLGPPAERELSARLLGHSDLPGDEVVDEVIAALPDEQDPQVIRWLVAALQHAGAPQALTQLKDLAQHTDARVRFGVPDALSACSRSLGDVQDLLLKLSNDDDREVRWSAIFELVAWYRNSQADPPSDLEHLQSRLREVANSDPDGEIRSLALSAFSE